MAFSNDNGFNSSRTDRDEAEEELVKGLVEQIGTHLGIRSRKKLEQLDNILGNIVQKYNTEKLFLSALSTPKKQKRLIYNFGNQLMAALETLNKISPEYRVAIEGLVKGSDDPYIFNTIKFAEESVDLVNATTDFLELYEPNKGRPTNLALEWGIRVALPEIEALAGEPAAISWNKTNENAPQPGNKAAESVVHIFKAIDGSLTMTSILNMIEKVQNRSEEPPSHLDAIIEAEHIGNLMNGGKERLY